MTEEEWAKMDAMLAAWARRQTENLEKTGVKFERPTCNDCRQPIEPWELRVTLGENVYHDRCGPLPR